ncbi:MAG: hypothetical protein IPO21_01895 [Bacteroidales bacterium]|nr:hypothetical protein [Bacteroidales bacterium]
MGKYKRNTKVTEYIVSNYNLCEYHDQDGLNGALFQYRYNLSPIWNQQIGIYFVDKTFVNSIWEDADIAIKKPIIVHFNGMEKPWNLISAHPYKKQFRNYAKKVTELSHKEPFKIKKLLKRILIYGINGWIEANKKIYYKTRKVHQ